MLFRSAVLLYALAGRPAPIISEAMRGLGYGILTLCVGALAGAGVVPPAVVLLGILLLSLAVGLHGVRQGRLLGTATALAGASISTWILADNLPTPAMAQLALLGIMACTVFAERRLAERGLVQPTSALLSLFPAGVLGLVVTTSAYAQPGTPADVGAASAHGGGQRPADRLTGPHCPGVRARSARAFFRPGPAYPAQLHATQPRATQPRVAQARAGRRDHAGRGHRCPAAAQTFSERWPV